MVLQNNNRSERSNRNRSGNARTRRNGRGNSGNSTGNGGRTRRKNGGRMNGEDARRRRAKSRPGGGRTRRKNGNSSNSSPRTQRKRGRSNSNRGAPARSKRDRNGMYSGSGRAITQRWSQLDEQEYCFKRNAAKYQEMISYHEFERNFYVPSTACTSMSETTVKKWTQNNCITIKPGYSEYMTSSDHNSKGHVLNGKIPNPVLEFDHVKWPQADDIASNLSRAFDKPTPIQSATWPLLLSGLNVIGIAQTGSGKTLAFLLPAIVHMRAQPKSKDPRVLIVLPTRELALQVEEEINKFARSVNHVCVYGGASAEPQLAKIRRGVQIVVATPGRLMDYISKGQINMGQVTFVVWDEADKLLDMGFKPQLDRIMEVIRVDKQMLMFSATWPESVRQMACEHMLDYDGGDRNVVQVAVGNINKFNANEDITQKFIFLQSDWEKDGVLFDFLEQHPDSKVLVFMSMKRQCQYMERRTYREGFRADSIHGDKKQAQREKALDKFRRGRTKILFATDVAGRGIHVDDIDYVINYDLPDRGFEDYVHRIGRTARAGRKGVSISYFVPKWDSWSARELVKVLEHASNPYPNS